MRARNIKPGFYKNEQLAECSFEARLLFPGLWMLADRSGRMEYRPKRIKAEIFPFDNIDIVSLTRELEREGLVFVYEESGSEYLWIPGFLNHQVPHCKEKQSIIPPHPREICTVQAQCQHGTSTVQAQCQHGTSTVQAQCQHPLNPESLNLNPESISSTTARAEVGQFSMMNDWKPSEFFPILAATAGVIPPGEEQLQIALQEFVPFWMTKNRKQTAHEWDLTFIKAIKAGFTEPKKRAGKGNQRISPRQQYMEDVGNLLEQIDGATNNGRPSRLGEAVEPLPGERPQLGNNRQIGF